MLCEHADFTHRHDLIENENMKTFAE
jgi:hypothetical protein